MSFRHVIPLLRLRFVPFALIPQALGLVLATGRLNPLDWPGRWGLAAFALLLACGPIYLFNDAVDLEDDRTNPRRQQSPLVRGWISRREVIGWGIGFQVAALILAAGVSWEFFWMMSLLGVVGLLYSIPPFRCKARPGWDILIQAGGEGLLLPLTGWTIARSFAGTPWWFYLHMVLAWMSPLLLVMLYDLPTDRDRGIRTTAVCLGVRGTVAMSVLTWGLAMVLLPVFAVTRYLITPRFLLYALPLTAILLLFLPQALRLRTHPVRLKRYIYRATWLGLLPYLLWFLVLGGILPP